MCEAIARKVVDRAAGRRVLTVTIRVGHLRQVVPDAMTFAWEMLTTTTSLDGARLEIEHVPATVACDGMRLRHDTRRPGLRVRHVRIARTSRCVPVTS